MDPETQAQAEAIGRSVGLFLREQRFLFAPFLQQESFLYWPYLASFVAIAAILYLLRRERGSGRGLLDFLRSTFPAAIYWSPSAKADYRFYFVNGVLFPSVFVPMILSAGWLSDRVQQFLSAQFGTRAPVFDDPTPAIVIYSLIFFVLYDFGRWVGHYVQHRSEILWEFHKVHHTAEVLTPMTSYRAHPVDLICMALFPALFTGLASGLYNWSMGGAYGFYTVVGLHVGMVIYNLFANLRHSHIWLSYGRLSYLFISPAMHQIHHSTNPAHFGMNVGFALAIWDKAAGSLYVPEGRERFDLGIGDGTEPEWHSVRAMYFKPFVNLFTRYLGGRRTAG